MRLLGRSAALSVWTALVGVVVGLIVVIGPPVSADVLVPSAIDLQAPPQVDRNAEIHATGTLTTDPEGAPIAGAVLDWRANCVSEDYAPIATGQATTADDGTFAITYQPIYCTQARLVVTWSGAAAADLDRVAADTDEPWKYTQLDVVAPASVYIGDPAHLTATYSVDGEPTSDVHVTVAFTTAEYPSNDPLFENGTTDADGKVTFSIPTLSGPSWQANLSAQGASDAIPRWWSGSGAIVKVPTTASMSPVGQTYVMGDTIKVTGTVYRPNGDYAGVLAYVYETEHDYAGWQPLGNVETDDQGHFTVSFVPQHPGTVTFSMTVPGSSDPLESRRKYDETTSPPVDETVIARHASLTITPDRSSYVAGQTATFHVDYANDVPQEGRLLTVTATPPGELGRYIYDDLMWPGGQDVQQRITTIETVTAEVAPDNVYDGAETSVHVTVREALSPAARSTFRAGRRPRLKVSNGSGRAQECVQFLVQRRLPTGWADRARSGCIRTDAAGIATWRPNLAGKVGPRYRFRAIFAGDQLDLAAKSPWQNFRFQAT